MELNGLYFINTANCSLYYVTICFYKNKFYDRNRLKTSVFPVPVFSVKPGIFRVVPIEKLRFFRSTGKYAGRYSGFLRLPGSGWTVDRVPSLFISNMFVMFFFEKYDFHFRFLDWYNRWIFCWSWWKICGENRRFVKIWQTPKLKISDASPSRKCWSARMKSLCKFENIT